MKKTTITLLFLSLLLFPCCSKDDAPVTPYTPPLPDPKYASFIMTSDVCSYTGYGCCRITGTVKNVGEATGYNVGIEFQAYSMSNVIIDTAHGFPADLGNIPVGVSASYEAIFFDSYNWALISKYTYEITWLTVSGSSMMQTGTIR